MISNIIKNLPEEIKIKRGLVKGDKIADYMEQNFAKYGFNVERNKSKVSDSQYLKINNYGDITGRPQKEIKIRISGHDLPEHYYEDQRPSFDIRAGNSKREGGESEAQGYEEVMKHILSGVSPDVINAKNQEEKENAKMRKEILVPEYLKSDEEILKKIEESREKDKTLNSVVFLSELLHGGSWNGYKKPSLAGRTKHFKEVFSYLKNNPEEYEKYKFLL